MKFHCQLMCAALCTKYLGFRSGQCMFCTSPNISGIAPALMNRFVRVPTFCSGTEVPEFHRGTVKWLDRYFVFSAWKQNFLPSPQCSKTSQKSFKRSFWKTSVFGNTPFSAPSPPVVTGLSKTLQCNSSGQQRKAEFSTLRQCPAASFLPQAFCSFLLQLTAISPQNKI